MYACPQCLPSDIVPIRSWTRTLRRPGIRHRHLPCHAMPYQSEKALLLACFDPVWGGTRHTHRPQLRHFAFQTPWTNPECTTAPPPTVRFPGADVVQFAIAWAIEVGKLGCHVPTVALNFEHHDRRKKMMPKMKSKPNAHEHQA